MSKCRYYKNCEYYNKNGITCNKGKKDKSYCGSYRQKRLNDKILKKGWQY